MKIIHTLFIGIISISAVGLIILLINQLCSVYPKLVIGCFATFMLFVWAYGLGLAVKGIWQMYKNP